MKEKSNGKNQWNKQNLFLWEDQQNWPRLAKKERERNQITNIGNKRRGYNYKSYKGLDSRNEQIPRKT